MAKDSSLVRLKKRAQQALKKDLKDQTYKEAKDVSNWNAVKKRWEAMKGNQYASGLVRTEETLEKMRSAQRMRRKRELQKRWKNVRIRRSGSSSED